MSHNRIEQNPYEEETALERQSMSRTGNEIRASKLQDQQLTSITSTSQEDKDLSVAWCQSQRSSTLGQGSRSQPKLLKPFSLKTD